jgi:tetratricopeptide (TPR) repeat protein
MIRWKVGAAALIAVMLGACSQPPLTPPTSNRLSPTRMVEAIRAASAKDLSVVQVTPLRNPAVSGYLDRAHADENAGRYHAALAKIDAALKLSPKAPDILQFRAEVEILLRQYSAADADARRSFQLGPKVGGLCAANWQTVLEIAKSQNQSADVAAASAKRDACRKAAPIEM